MFGIEKELPAVFIPDTSGYPGRDFEARLEWAESVRAQYAKGFPGLPKTNPVPPPRRDLCLCPPDGDRVLIYEGAETDRCAVCGVLIVNGVAELPSEDGAQLSFFKEVRRA